jgi:hypothetical protein
MIHPVPPNVNFPSFDKPLRFDDKEYAPALIAAALPPTIHFSTDVFAVARGVAIM